MIIHINDFNGAFVSENENCPIFPVNPEAPDSQMARLKQFRLQTWIRRIVFKKRFLFLKLPFQFVPPKIHSNFPMQRQNLHA